MDIYSRLKGDHRNFEQWAEEITRTEGDSDERNRLWEQLKTDVEAHTNAEEQTFYAELMKNPDAQEKTQHSTHEHKESADLIEELDELDMGSGGWLQKFKKFKEELEHHIKEEENEMFPIAKKVLSDRQADSLGELFAERKQAEL